MMTNNKKVALIILILLTICYVKDAFFSPEKTGNHVEISQDEENEATEDEKVSKKADTYINVFFIGKNENGDELYRAVKRKYDKDENGQQLSFAISKLVEGPNQIEREKGIYSEIPSGTKVI